MKASERRNLDPAHAVTVWRLDGDDLGSVRSIAGRSLRPYDFRQKPDSKTRIPLEEFILSWEEVFPFAKADVLDRWAVNSLNAEAFNHYIDRTKLGVPGILSATTTAKLIAYCLLIMEAEHEALQAARVESLRFVRPDAQDVVNSLVARARLGGVKKEGAELDYSVQFCEAVRNPVIKEGVNNAAVNRWGLRGNNRKKSEQACAGEEQS